ncbi:unnamed protein product [Calicophoron daubneyi]|uniref:Uncharacterized protein n=1 Tax=Calicophoron daubneyi TaxID=300641 RepID=A0AAV2TRC5_CALDB
MSKAVSKDCDTWSDPSEKAKTRIRLLNILDEEPAKKAKQKLASRKVVFDQNHFGSNFGLDENEPLHAKIKQSSLSKLNSVDGPLDLREQVQDLSAQLEELGRLTRSVSKHPPDCFCHGCSLSARPTGPADIPGHRLPHELPNTPPPVCLNPEPDCCVSCTVPCAVSRCAEKDADEKETADLTYFEQMSRLNDRQQTLKSQLLDLSNRLSTAQAQCSSEPSGNHTFKISRERDVDEHLDQLARCAVLDGTSPTSSPREVRPLRIRNLPEQKPTRSKQASTSTTEQRKPFVCGRVRPLDLSANRNFRVRKRPTVQANQNASRLSEMGSQDDPECTLAELAARLSNSEAALSSKLLELDNEGRDGNISSEQTSSELRDLAEELRTMQSELRDQLAEVQKYLTNRPSEDDSNNVFTKEKLHAPPPSEPPLEIGSLLPSLRQVMDHAGKEFALTTESLELPADPSKTSSKILPQAASVLAAAHQRRKNLENNFALLEQNQGEQSIFNLLELMNQGRSSAEKARIQAMINDAIAQAGKNKHAVEKPLKQNNRQAAATARLYRSDKSRKSPLEPRRSPSPAVATTQTLAELMLGPPRASTSRSPSPELRRGPWRLNRRRAKRPLYPRLINDPVPCRTAVLRLSDDQSKKSLPIIGRSPEFPASGNTKTVRFQDDPLQHARRPISAGTPRRRGIIPLGKYQYSGQVQPGTDTKGVQSSICVSPDLLCERGKGINFRHENIQNAPSANVPTQPPELLYPTCPTRPEDELISRLVLQLAGQLGQRNAQTEASQQPYGALSEAELRLLVEEALLEQIEPLLPRSPPRTPSPDENSLRLPTPTSSPEHFIRTPGFSSGKSSPARTRKSMYDAMVGNSTLSSIASQSPQSQDDVSVRHDISTPCPSCQPSGTTAPLPSPHSIRTGPAGSARKPDMHSAQTSPIRICRSISLSPDRPKTLTHHSADFTPLPTDMAASITNNEESSLSSPPFSLTAPDTFSEGMWLIDRSEGEAPSPVPYGVVRQIAAKLEPLPISPPLISENSRNIYEDSTPSTRSENEESPATEKRQLSTGELALPTLTSRSSKQVPLRDPALQIIALKTSGGLSSSNLPSSQRNLVKQATNKMSQQRPNQPGTNLEWLANLSGRESPPHSLGSVHSQNRMRPVPRSRPTSTPLVDRQENSLSDSPKLDWLRSLAGEVKQENPAGDSKSRFSPGMPQVPMLQGVEMVHSEDSDATTIDENAYENDYIVESDEQQASEHSQNTPRLETIRESKESTEPPNAPGTEATTPIVSGGSPVMSARQMTGDEVRRTVTLDDDSEDAADFEFYQ